MSQAFDFFTPIGRIHGFCAGDDGIAEIRFRHPCGLEIYRSDFKSYLEFVKTCEEHLRKCARTIEV